MPKSALANANARKIMRFFQIFRIKKKKVYKVTENKEDAGKQTQENKSEYIKFVKSAEPCINELLVESFITQLSFIILENKLNEKNIARYRGLGFLVFITKVFFNFDRKINIKLIDLPNQIINFEFDVTGLQGNQSSVINSDIIDSFVAGEENSIQQLYFPETLDSSFKTASSVGRASPVSNDWAEFRIECNKTIRYILSLSKECIESMIPEGLNKLENAENKWNEWIEVILAKQNNLHQAVLKSKEYTRYKLPLMASNPITHENMESTIKSRYRNSQFFLLQPDKTVPVVNRVELEESNNNNLDANFLHQPFWL